jgi:hypothetical protein
MYLKSKLSKFALCAATGALATMTAAGPAIATTSDADGGGHRHGHYKGRVIAKSGLLLRDAPWKGGHVIGSVPYGKIVKIACKVNGQNVNGNPRWYLLTNGKWAWASARYIKNIGPAPHWC